MKKGVFPDTSMVGTRATGRIGRWPLILAAENKLQMPTIDVLSTEKMEDSQVRRRRRREAASGAASSASVVEERPPAIEEDNTWYLYLPGLVGAGTALLVVGLLSFSSWRKGQAS